MHQEIIINAPREHVWKVMLDKPTYEEWTKGFNPTSSFEGNWEQGTEMRFVGTDENAPGVSGMLATIEENRAPEFLSIKHLGVIKDGVADTTSEEVQKWAGAHENYTFIDKDGATELHIDMDVDENAFDFMNDAWAKVKRENPALFQVL